MMDNAKKSYFSFRSFVSTLTLFSFLMVVFAGAILFLTPPGRVAHWTGWQLIGLSKDQWIAVHICFSIIFLISSILHVYLNFKPLINYFKNASTKKFSLKPEWLAAAVITFAVLLGTLAPIPPFSTVMSINHDLKFRWDEPGRRAPMPHAEVMTLSQLGKRADLDIEAAIANLRAANIEPANPETAINQLAMKYNMTPENIYRIALGGKPMKPGQAGPACDGQRRGLGRMTLKQFCKAEDIDLVGAIEILKENGIDARKEQTLRELADIGMTNPMGIAEMLKKK